MKLKADWLKVKKVIISWKNKNAFMYVIWMETLRLRALINLKRFDDRAAIFALYQSYSGRAPNIDHPVRFSEKLQWLKLNFRIPLQSIVVDKHAVREWLTKRGYEDLLNKQLMVINKAEDLNFDILPNRFVVKAAHASGWNLVCKDKETLSRYETKLRVAAWLRQGIFWNGREWPYKAVPHRVVVEAYLEDESGGLRDYKLYCFNGEPQFIQANSGRMDVNHAQNFYDLKWNLLPFGKDLAPRPDIVIPQPASMERMISIARDLASKFPYVRIDFYDIYGRIVFGEMTFYPASGLPDFTPDEQDFACGEMLDLSNLQKRP